MTKVYKPFAWAWILFLVVGIVAGSHFCIGAAVGIWLGTFTVTLTQPGARR